MADQKIKAFCKKYGLTEDQFYGRKKYDGDLNLSDLTVMPEGFNPTVGGYLNMPSVTAMNDVFNPTVGGSLYMPSVTAKERQKIKIKPYPTDMVFTWQNGKYILADEIFSEVVSRRRNVYRIKNIASAKIGYLVTDGQGRWAHGDTLREARSDLVYKISDRDTSKYKGLSLDHVFSHDDAIVAYRVITGACSTGTKAFVSSLAKVKKQYSIREIIELTNGQYGSTGFAQFFTEKEAA